MRTIAPEQLLERLRQRLGVALLSLSLPSFSGLAACEAPRGTIGAVIAQDGDTGRLFVRDVPHGLAANKAGIQRGDEILLIDGLDVRSMSSHQIHAALAGDVDASVKLTLVRGQEQIIRATLKRTEARRLVKALPMTDQ